MEEAERERQEQLRLDRSAVRITRFFRDILAKQTYTRMARGEFHKNLFMRLQGKPATEGFKELSHANLARLRAMVAHRGGGLDASEKRLIDRLTTEKLFLVHHSTNDGLIQPDSRGKDALTLYSREKLIRKKLVFPANNTTPMDIRNLKDDDFVFFSVVLYPTAKERSRFGTHAYVMEVDDHFFRDRKVFMTAGDYAAQPHSIAMHSGSSQVIRATLAELHLPPPAAADLQMLTAAYGSALIDCFFNYEVPLASALQHHCFMGGDILPGIAFLVILFRRLIIECLSAYSGSPMMKHNMTAILQRVAQPELSVMMLNALINSVVNPIIKVPRFVMSESASRVQFS